MSCAHTAEHIFLGSLTRLIHDVRVQKVEITPEKNSVYVNCSSLDWDIILAAEKMANQVISEGRRVMAHNFPTLEDAKQALPQLRAHEDRISGPVSVIEIEGYDYSACTGSHVQNTNECVFFIATRLAKANRNLFEIEFEVGERAKEEALAFSTTCMKAAEILGVNVSILEKAAQNVRDENTRLKERFTSLTIKTAESIPPVEKGGVKLYVHMFDGLYTKRLMDHVGGLIGQDKALVIFSNTGEQPIIVLARSQDLTSIDCNQMIRETLSSYGGKGGGKPDYAFGTVSPDQVDRAMQDLQARVEKQLSSV